MHIHKRLGIYLNYQEAHIIQFTAKPLEPGIIASDFTHQEKTETLLKGEKTMHHKEQHEQLAYFKKLGETIKSYDEVLLFGPTKAKDELNNLLKADSHFDKIDITVKTTDDISEKEQQLFVMHYFSKKLSPNSI